MVALPEEVLEQICWELGPGTTRFMGKSWVRKRITLYHLMCSSKTLYRLARPVLYHTMLIGIDAYDISLHRLLQLCITRPEITDFIREIYLGYFHSYSPDEDVGSLPLGEVSNMGTLIAATKSISISEELRADLQERLTHAENQDVMIALLMVLCKNLTVVDMHTIDWKSTVTLHLVRELVSQPSVPETSSLKFIQHKPLQHLHTFHTEHWDTEGFQQMLELCPFLQLPSMVTFTGAKMGLTGWGAPFDFDVRYSLRYIDLSDSNVDIAGLEWLLIACPCLVELGIQLGDSDYGEVSFGYIGDCLRRHGTRLERFKFFTNDDYQYRVSHQLGDLASMDHLKALHVEWLAVSGGRSDLEQIESGSLAAMLPTSLEQLEVRKAPSTMSEDENFLDAWFLNMMTSDRLPNLSVIRMRRHASFALDVPQDWRDCSKIQQQSTLIDVCLERIMTTIFSPTSIME